MCTRFVYNGNDTIAGFNFDIDLSVWNHKVIAEEDRFFIGIKMPDRRYHSFHGVSCNGNVGTLLYVHGNAAGKYVPGCPTIANITEDFIRGRLSLDGALDILKRQNIVYAPDATMQSMLSGREGRALLIEPGIGYRLEKKRYSLVTNYSLLNPRSTEPFIVPGDNRFERAENLLAACGDNFSPRDAFAVLKSVCQEGIWATRVSFVYSAGENKVYYVLNREFDHIQSFSFQKSP